MTSSSSQTHLAQVHIPTSPSHAPQKPYAYIPQYLPAPLEERKRATTTNRHHAKPVPTRQLKAPKRANTTPHPLQLTPSPPPHSTTVPATSTSLYPTSEEPTFETACLESSVRLRTWRPTPVRPKTPLRTVPSKLSLIPRDTYHIFSSAGA